MLEWACMWNEARDWRYHQYLYTQEWVYMQAEEDQCRVVFFGKNQIVGGNSSEFVDQYKA